MTKNEIQKSLEKVFNVRTDLSNRLTHLTKKTNSISAMDVLVQILSDKKIKSHDFMIGGRNNVVCFTEVPYLAIAEMMELREKDSSIASSPIFNRFEGYGISYDRFSAFERGVRPVIYGDKEEYQKILPDQTDYWKVVNYDPENDYRIDWTYEREWRVPGDFDFEYKDVEIIIPHAGLYEEFKEKLSTINIKSNEIPNIVFLDDYLSKKEIE